MGSTQSVARRSLAVAALLLSAPTWALPPVPCGVVPPAVLRPGDQGPEWSRAAVLGPFVRADAAGAVEAPTLARVCRTDAALWLRVECDEPRLDQLAATHRDRDGVVWEDDCVEVFVQRPGQPRYVHAIVNPLGTQFDEVGRDATWNADWRAEASRSETGWAVDLSFPWAVFGGPPAADETWRVNVCRARHPEPEQTAWSATGGGFHVPERFGGLRFGDGPWPVVLAWDLTGRRSGRVRLEWQPAGVAGGLRATVNGKAVAEDGAFTFAEEGTVALVLEASAGAGAPVLRAVHVVEVTPMDAVLDAVRRRAGALPADLGAPLAEQRRALLERLERLAGLAAKATPAEASALAEEAGRLEVRSSHLAVIAACATAGAKPDSIAYGVESPLRKMLPHRPFGGQSGGAVRLDAGRREMAAAQVVVVAGERPLPRVRAEFGEFRANGEQVLPADALRVRRVGYVPTRKPTYAVEYVGLWPDPLLEAGPFDVAAGGAETLWLDARVPAETEPGLYCGELRLSSPAAEPTVVPVEIRVRRFTIPAMPSLCTAFGLGPAWRVPQNSDAYVRNYLEHRLSPYSVAGSPKLLSPPATDWSQATALAATVESERAGSLSLLVVPANGQAPRRLGPVAVAAGTPSQARFDLAGLAGPVQDWRLELTGPLAATVTAWLETPAGRRPLCDTQRRAVAIGADGWLDAWPTWTGSGWDTPDRPARWDWAAFDQAMETYLPLGVSAHIAPLREPLAGWARAVAEHLAEKGWLDLAYTYLYDEPEPAAYPRLNHLLGTVKRAAPGLRNMMTARHFPPELRYVDIWCPEAYSFDPEAARGEQARGRAVWWYVAFSTRHPYPNVWIDYPALDCRVWPWMTWKHDLDGMLYWSATYWSRSDPWRTGEAFPGANGDGSLLYPGEDGRPLDSIRWECLRDGLEDYEVFCLLEAGARELRQAGQRPDLVERATALCAVDDTVVRSWKEYNPDPAALLAARGHMGDTLDEIVGALGHEPRIEGRPRRRPGVDMTAAASDDRAESAPGAVAGAPAGGWVLPVPDPEPGLVLRYDFDDSLPFAADRSGGGNHGLVRSAQRAPGVRGQALRLAAGGKVVLPAAAEFLGPQPATGTVAVWVDPAFGPTDLSADQWQGYAVAFYLMETDGNGLPDGLDEIGVFAHGPDLLARCGGPDAALGRVPTPLRPGVWTHLCLVWAPDRRTLYVNGQPAIDRPGAFQAPRLDAFPAALGAHPCEGRWPWNGSLDEFRVYRRALTAAEVAALATR